ncbi:MAG: DMT family transporter [Paracoccaceae bacterium]
MSFGRSAQGHAAMLVFSALVAGSFALGARAAPHVDPAVLSALRFVIAAAILAAVARMAARGAVLRALAVAPWRWGVLGGLMAAYFVLMFEGLKTATSVSTAAVFTLTPVMAAGFGWLFLRQRLTARMALALALGAAGALWVIFRGDLAALARMHVGRGEAIYFWGCAAHAAYAALVRRLNRGESPVVTTFGTMAAGAGLLVLWSLPALRATDWAALPGIVWLTLAYVSVAATALTLFLVQFAALRLPAAKVMAYTYLVPSWVILWEIALGGALPPALILAGVGLCIGALALLLKE